MPDRYLLDFEEPLHQIREKIKEIEEWHGNNTADRTADIRRLEEQEKKLSEEIYSNLTNWQRVQIARHPKRLYTLDYIENLFEDFTELHGDRRSGDDPAMIAGFAKFGSRSVAVIGQQKGRDNESRIMRNFGMANPEGYRKAMRVMKIAEKFNRPVLTFVDTPGAFPGIEAEERGQGEAIAVNLMEMSRLKVPIIVTIIGEGGSGGALGIGVGDRVVMLENSWYSVIAPESCSMILVKNPDKKDKFAQSLKLTASELKKLGIIDEIVNEPLGGVHNDPQKVIKQLKTLFGSMLDDLTKLSPEKLVNARMKKLMRIGRWSE